MGIENFFLPHHYLASELNALQGTMQKRIAFWRERRASDKARIDELEADLARVALLARSLAEVCLDKGVLTKDELRIKLLEVDMADGARDKGLDPKVALPGESKLAELRPITPPPPRRRRR